MQLGIAETQHLLPQCGNASQLRTLIDQNARAIRVDASLDEFAEIGENSLQQCVGDRQLRSSKF